MSNDIKTALPPLPNPCEYAYVEGRAMQGSEYRRLSGYDPDSAMFSPDQMRAYAEAAVLAASAPAQPKLTVIVRSFPESNGKRNWTALLRRTEPFGGLIGSAGGISLAHGEFWNRVAYEAERTKFLLGLRDTEPFILDYGDDIETPDEWKGEPGAAIDGVPPCKQANPLKIR